MQRVIKSAILLICITIISSCAYYNSFHNAKKLFKEAEERELDNKGKASRTARGEYNKVIKKCGTILEFYPTSKYVDDAIYLMAMSFYHKGGNNRKADEQCDKLMQFFPDSELYVDAVILKAQIKKDNKKHSEAYNLLEQILLNPKYIAGKSKVLLKIAEFNTADERFERARYYLNLIIQEHEGSVESKKASKYLGLNYLAEEDYEEAIIAFRSFLKLKNDREIENDILLNIAYSYFKLENYNKAIKYVDDLIDDEYRKNEKNNAKVLRGQILLARGNDDDGIKVLNKIIKGNQRGEASAKANYVLGDYYLTNTDSLKLSIKLFNAVKNAQSNSEYVKLAVAKSSVASQIKLFKDDDGELEPDELIKEQFKLAEYYLEIMALPDSALSVYDNIIESKFKFETLLDTVNIKKDSLTIVMDSLSTLEESMNSEIDSLRIIVENTDTMADTTITEDSLRTKDPNGERMLALEADKDSLVQVLDIARRSLQTVENRSSNIENAIHEFDQEYIPFANFVKAIIYYDNLQDTLKTYQVIDYLVQNYPDSKYTYALKRFKNGEKIVISTEKEEKSKHIYNDALQYFDADPDSTIAILETNIDSLVGNELIQAKMSLGYLYYIVKSDTVAARVYFDTLLAAEDLPDDNRDWINIYYMDNKFNFYDTLPLLDQIENGERDREEEDLKGELEDKMEDIEDAEDIEKEAKDNLDKVPDEGLENKIKQAAFESTPQNDTPK